MWQGLVRGGWGLGRGWAEVEQGLRKIGFGRGKQGEEMGIMGKMGKTWWAR